MEDKSGEEEKEELNKARILVVMDGSSWLERRKEEGGHISHGRFSTETICAERHPAPKQRGCNRRLVCSTNPSEDGGGGG